MAVTSSRIRPVASTPAQRRVARALALEPGLPPTARARAASRVIRLGLRSVWEHGPDGDAGMLLVQRATALLARFQLVPRGVTITPQDFGRGASEWVRAGAPDERKVLLYLHGGGYFFGGPRLYRPFAWRLAAATARPVLMLDYRLAPRHTPADALDDAVGAYEFLLDRGYAASDIVVGGDSAGGHLALALLLALRDRDRPLPGAAFFISPWADLLCEADSHRDNARTDALIPAARLASAGRSYCEAHGGVADSPLLAPGRADLTGLPPSLFMASTTEILRDDARTAVARARAAGVDVVHQEWDGLVHVFPVFADYIPEGRAAFRHIAEFLRGAGA
ncbi:alpha/beta hydrolase [Actinomadura rayongensis]|uniref:Alpha/beta hydrolase fold domain-containing protein n=1 Tax=Actinomadura rayongensis TaxID=1429076 RepID=A0A6I4VX51_9ACTN|nr:alpha/beta hydrolase [Actinomadura rayongensis]MXQ62919.1 alpha/beta hydrolase fold domain-containing protein [Actinomadura rayongensis]